MKAIVLGLLGLISLNLKAQNMKKPNEVVCTLFIATDNQDWETVKATFSNQVLLDYSSMNGSPASKLTPEQIVAAWKGILPGFQSTHHQLGNFVVSEQNKQAHVFCYGTASHYLPNEQGDIWLVVGSYDFELVKDSEKNWKIASMKFNFKYQDGNTSLPELAINKLK